MFFLNFVYLLNKAEMRVERFYSFQNLIAYVNLPLYRWVNYEYKRRFLITTAFLSSLIQMFALAFCNFKTI